MDKNQIHAGIGISKKTARKPIAFTLAFAAVLFAACSRKDEPLLPGIPWYEDTAALQADFNAALAAAQHPDETKVSTTLMPVTEDNPGLEWISVDTARLVLVSTMLNARDLRYWEAADTFRVSKWTGLWVTLPADWTHRASEFAGLDSAAARYRMIQMLGLYPSCDYDTVVEFYADVSGLFRPARDPDITTTTCGTAFPAYVTGDYTVGETLFREWFNDNLASAYTGDYACPWTQLGYTRDWHCGAPHEGLSEYIVSRRTLARVKVRQGAWTFIQSR